MSVRRDSGTEVLEPILEVLRGLRTLDLGEAESAESDVEDLLEMGAGRVRSERLFCDLLEMIGDDLGAMSVSLFGRPEDSLTLTVAIGDIPEGRSSMPVK
jgi:hypothetical protein